MIVIFDLGEEHGRFRGSREGAKGSKEKAEGALREREGSTGKHQGSIKGAREQGSIK